MARPAAVVTVLLITPMLIGATVGAVADNGGGGFGGPVEFGTNRGVSPSDRTTDEFIASTASCGPLPDEHFAADAGEGDPALALELVVELPLASVMTFTADGTAFVGQQTGQVWLLRDGELSDEPVVDLSADTSTRDDQGLLGLAVDPAGDWLYVHHTDALGDGVIRAYPLEAGIPDPYGEERIVVVDQPTRQHNGGALQFGPDGYLWVTFGDGGGLGDPYRNAQDPGTVLGSVVRFEPRPGQIPPAVPAPDNPWPDGERAEPWSWAYGTRNPFRFAFDRETGDLWLPDLGQQCMEEINVLRAEDAGANLGWNIVEGTRDFLGTVADVPDHHAPLFEYRHDVGICAVVGGTVYRGDAIAGLDGRYVFTDYCDGHVLALDPSAGTVLRWDDAGVTRPVGIAEDPDGELWVTSLDVGVLHVVPAD